MLPCTCTAVHDERRVVLTGGPGAGKTAVLELIGQSVCEHVVILSEAAGVVFGGGFPRQEEMIAKRAAQRAIFHVQRELENAAVSRNPAIVLCDRGTVDGLAYWPGDVEEFWSSVGSTLPEQLGRYRSVIHLRSPSLEFGYNYQNPLRVESAAAAAAIDARILEFWSGHSTRFVIESSSDFLDKAAMALHVLRPQVPECCRHVIPDLHGRARFSEQR